MLKISASCNPIGLGLSGDRVANTPVVFALGLFRGLVVRVWRSDLWSHVSRITFDPRVNPERACKYFSSIRTIPAGAPSDSCNGQSPICFNGVWTVPINSTDSILHFGICKILPQTVISRVSYLIYDGDHQIRQGKIIFSRVRYLRGHEICFISIWLRPWLLTTLFWTQRSQVHSRLRSRSFSLMTMDYRLISYRITRFIWHQGN